MPEKYHPFLRVLHWVMGPLIIVMLGVGWYMANMMEKTDPLRPTIYDLHKSIGVTLLALIIVRIAARFSTPVPPLPSTIQPLIRASAKVTHYVLYIFMVLMPVTGYGMSNSFGKGVALFGLPLPKIFPDNKDVGSFLRQLHGWFGYALMALVAMHIVAAVYHRFFDMKENNILPRII